MKPARSVAALGILGGVIFVSPCRADLAGDLKAEEDPTILAPRAWADTEWSRFRDSSSDFDVTLGRLWAWRLSGRTDLALRFKLPLRTHQAGDDPGDSDQYGIGDMKVAAGVATRLTDTWRAGAGIEMRFPTATDDALGANVWRPMLFGVMAWDLTPSVTFSPSAEYNKSIAEEDGAAPQHFAEFFFPLTFIAGRWSVTARFELKVDFANGDEVTRSAKLAASTRLEGRPMGLSFSVKKPIDRVDKKIQLNFVATWYLH